MKTLNLTFDDADFARLKRARAKNKSKSWEAFIIKLIGEQK